MWYVATPNVVAVFVHSSSTNTALLNRFRAVVGAPVRVALVPRESQPVAGRYRRPRVGFSHRRVSCVCVCVFVCVCVRVC